MENIIPPITHPLGKGWDQPDTEKIHLSDYSASMKQKECDALKEYSTSNPTGVYAGKMWKRRVDDGFILCWWSDSEKEGFCIFNSRKLIII